MASVIRVMVRDRVGRPHFDDYRDRFPFVDSHGLLWIYHNSSMSTVLACYREWTSYQLVGDR